MSRDVVLDVSRMRVSEAGVADFVWPVARAELLAVRDRLFATTVPYLRAESKTDRQATVLSLFIHFYNEVLGLYHTNAVIRRLQQRGLNPVLPPRGRLYPAMLARQTPPTASTIRLLERGIARAPLWRRTARTIRDSLGTASVRRREISRVDLGKDIVTIATGDMIWQHASALNEPVNYVRFEEWFHPLSSSDRAGYGGAPRAGLIDAMLDLVRDAFAAGNEALPDHCAQSLRSWLLSAATLADRYIARLLRQPTLVPRRLWRGTGGHVWARLLSHAVRELGGHVTGHDHAHGSSMFVTYSDTLVEHPGCHRFMVWTETQKQMSLRNIRHELAIQPAPEIAVVPGRFKPKILEHADLGRRSSGARTVMYVGTLYNDEFAPLTPLTPSVVLVDFEARLIGQLRALGYDVIVKPHPESEFAPPAAYADVLGARVMVEPFEDIYRQADITLFGQPNCTPFFGTVGTRQPAVIVDTGLHEWQPEADHLVRRRAGVVRTHFDPDNRIIIDPAALGCALQRAPVLMDDGFYDAFFAGNGIRNAAA